MRRAFAGFVVVFLMLFLDIHAAGQSLTSGAIVGVVVDPSGALIANATITAKNVDTRATATTASSAEGSYRLSFLAPGRYQVQVAASGFRNETQVVPVYLGQITTQDFRLQVGTAAQEVAVTSEAPMLQVENANLATSIGGTPLEELPNPGNDLTYVVQSAPGAVMNTQQGLGNVSTFGLPGTSNVFTVNGMQNNNSFLNVVNTGATSLLLGLGEVQELTVINNPYSGEYGTLAGAQINVVTKSGGNDLRGDAQYWWNGRVLNANNWFNKHTQPGQAVTPRSFDNANQWAASLGGPVRKDKTFFYVYTEGLRVVIPTSQPVQIPSPQFQAATLANLSGMGLEASVPFYQSVVFPLYNNARGAASAVPLPFTPQNNGGCGGFTFPGGLGTTVACALQFQSTVNNLDSEWILAMRLDQNLANNDRLFGRFRVDRGTQATFTDVINPLFNVVAYVPQYEGQLSETHTFGYRATNNFIMSGSWYGFTQSNVDRAATLNLFPTTLLFGDGTLTTLGGIDYYFPQGRNTTQYGFVDDISLVRGKDSFKFGVSFQRYDISDLDFPILSSGIVTVFTLNDFFNGGSTGDLLLQNFFTRESQPLALYRLGWYAQDERQFRPNLKVTAALRVDHNSVPVCQTNCFGRLATNFTGLNTDPTIPYNQLIFTGLHQAYAQGDGLLFQPRFGLVWQPRGLQDVVVRGGVGIFVDSLPGAVADRIGANPPQVNSFTLRYLPLAPTEPEGIFAAAAGANATFVNAYNGGASFADFLDPTSPFFSPLFIPPNVTNPPGRVRTPRYVEWSLGIEKGWGANAVFKATYVGNHGIFEAVQNNGVNGFCVPQACPAGFAGLPASPPDPRFGTINQLQSVGVSNYHGLTLSAQRRFNGGLYVQGNYTWSHALDVVSNGGFLNFNFATNNSVLNPQDPSNFRRFNYGNADYDVRHYVNLSYLYSTPFEHPLLRNWQVSGLLFARSGMPFTVIDGTTSNILNAQNYGGTVFAAITGTPPASCGSSAAGLDATPCLPSADFASPFTGFGNQRRNQFRGPRYFNTDLAIMRSVKLFGSEHSKFSAGVQFFNLFNHPNFDQPVANLADPRFGHIMRTVSTPTSVLGSFLGGDASPRLIRLMLRLSF